VVGRKTVWLAPAKFHEEIYPLSSESGLSNTSSLDVFSMTRANQENQRTKESYPLFAKVIEEAMIVTLKPGDLLFFPPGWWHSMRSEEKSFSVSFWF
jgi:lysine-specific demethylase 8